MIQSIQIDNRSKAREEASPHQNRKRKRPDSHQNRDRQRAEPTANRPHKNTIAITTSRRHAILTATAILLTTSACGTHPVLPPQIENQNAASTVQPTSPTTPAEIEPADQEETDPQKARALSTLLLGIGAIVIMFLIGSFVLIRMSRRARRTILKSTPDPTDTTDLWLLHQIDDDEKNPKKQAKNEEPPPDRDNHSESDFDGDSSGDDED